MPCINRCVVLPRLWLHLAMSYNQQCWESFRSDSQRLDFAFRTMSCHFSLQPAGQDHDATGMQNLSYTKALRKQKWLGDVQTWKIQALFDLEKFTCSQACIRALKAVPKWKKRNGDDANPFNLSGKSMRGVDTESLIGCGWKQWSGCQEYHGKSIDPYQGRSQAENQ